MQGGEFFFSPTAQDMFIKSQTEVSKSVSHNECCLPGVRQATVLQLHKRMYLLGIYKVCPMLFVMFVPPAPGRGAAVSGDTCFQNHAWCNC